MVIIGGFLLDPDLSFHSDLSSVYQIRAHSGLYFQKNHMQARAGLEMASNRMEKSFILPYYAKIIDI